MSQTARAAVVDKIGDPFTLGDVTLDTPRADEVLVRIVAAGVCGTDLGVQAGHIPFPLPGVLGHEGAGIVEEVGNAVTTVKPGDKVLLSFTSCGTCRNCRTAHPAYCQEFLPRNLIGGSRADGTTTISRGGEDVSGHFFAQSSFSTYALADERGVTKVSDTADLGLLAPLGCGIQTGAGAVLNILKPESGSTIAIFGVGAVGMAAVMAAKLTGAERIFAIDIVPSRLDLARELGATDVINSKDVDAAAELDRISGGLGIDYAIDATGNVHVLATAIECLAPLGTVAAIGAPAAGTTVAVDVNYLLNGRKFIGVTEGDAVPQVFLPSLVSLIEQGRFPLEKLVKHYRFDQINEAAEGIKNGSVLKPVLLFD
ncbi:NAD(P)-dependent alcohol dehydrogenase [Rhodococcus globerulus]|uniref:NAD(P)-dependent alcohol dehydrogenase n=1 Tax=Rhodococcus globerulus TaxID=33008 RepID=A0ABU4BXG5_RHOGO|nr:NAD(P)-dependent alcohol dehydrogenase [Rhodococcus globerulus]MDV6268890.1 NAD(P)-dependent alcohol dehydrogenase [Rhodococcus globerulus]